MGLLSIAAAVDGADTEREDDVVIFAFVAADEEVDIVDKEEEDCGMGKVGDGVAAAAVTVSGASGKPTFMYEYQGGMAQPIAKTYLCRTVQSFSAQSAFAEYEGRSPALWLDTGRLETQHQGQPGLQSFAAVYGQVLRFCCCCCCQTA